MSYLIESSTTTEPIEIEVEPMIIPLTDDTGKWNSEAERWFYSEPQETKDEV